MNLTVDLQSQKPTIFGGFFVLPSSYYNMGRLMLGSVWIWLAFIVGLPFAIFGWVVYKIKKFFTLPH
jgi:hypothetical protein